MTIQTLYRIPLEKHIIKQIPSLGMFDFDSCYCSSTYIGDLCDNKDLYLVSIFNTFDSDDKTSDINFNLTSELLFGRVLSEKFSIRGINKFVKIKEIKNVNLKKEDLPFLRYNSSLSNNRDGNWFFVRPAEYYILAAKKSTFQSVRHLETLSIYSEGILKLRIIIELLKNNISKGLIKNEEIDFYEIGLFYLKNEHFFKNVDLITLKSGVKNWIDEIILTPSYSDISEAYREQPITK